ncbi:MAG TPA: DUF3179 domain-containing protein [Ignavibacteria bacterium]|nr:DUF3179 domain-containing protein [Ignavibacteria bacterium]
MYRLKMFLLLLIPLFWSCDEVVNSSSNQIGGITSPWLIPKDEIFDGGPGKDGIPSLTNPNLIPANSVAYLNDNDLVIAIKIDDEIRVYPHPILDWHEIINDGINENKFSITYCPLTGSGIAYNRVINGTETTFGVSGLLYNTNLIPYDRATDSHWSQMKMLSVNGRLIGQAANTFPVIETTWRNIKSYYPDSKVVSNNTGHSRNYGRFPYGDYRTNHNFLLFPVSHNDSRLPRKERVLGIWSNGTAKAFRFASDNLSLTQSSIDGFSIIVVMSKNDNLITAYQSELESDERVELTLLDNQLPLILKDTDDNKYDIFGTIVSGPNQGARLKTITQYVAYWFAWVAFFPETTIE